MSPYRTGYNNASGTCTSRSNRAHGAAREHFSKSSSLLHDVALETRAIPNLPGPAFLIKDMLCCIWMSPNAGNALLSLGSTTRQLVQI